jgi:uncharacterized protein involved in outer membrane biogenesis
VLCALAQVARHGAPTLQNNDGTAMTLARTIGKSAAWIVGIVAVIIAAAGIFIFTFDWNRAKPWVNEHVSAALGRPFAINGDLKLGWRRPIGETGWRAWVPWPSLSATQLEIGNPDWAQGQKFVTLDAAHFDLAILPLFAHQIVIPSIDVVNPAVDLERLADGRNTWTFQFKQSGQPSKWQVRLKSFAFAKGTIVYRDAITKADLTIAVDTLGKPIPLGDVLKQQEQTSRAASAQRVGKRGAAQLSAKANADAASGASGAAAASGLRLRLRQRSCRRPVRPVRLVRALPRAPLRPRSRPGRPMRSGSRSTAATRACRSAVPARSAACSRSRTRRSRFRCKPT